MTSQTSTIRLQTADALTKMRSMVSLMDNTRSKEQARTNLESARDDLEQITDIHLTPAGRYPFAERVFERAVCVVADYVNQFSSAQVSLGPLTPNSVAHADMPGAMQLVSIDAVTHTAISDGSWNTAGNWSPAAVPPEGARVYISAARNMTYDIEATVSLKTVRVDGVLSIAHATSTKMIVDTMVIVSGGKLVADVSSNATCSIEFAGGSIDPSWDTRLLSRGLISMGNVSIIGKRIKPFTALVSNTAALSAQRLSLVSGAVGWSPNDRVILTPTSLNPNYVKWTSGPDHATQGAANSVAGLHKAGETNIYNIGTFNSANTVSLATPLQHGHTIPTHVSAGHSGMTPTTYIANCERNIVFRTQVSQPFSRKAHTMFMVNNFNVRNAKFKHMGRTNKRFFANDIDVLINNTSVNTAAGSAVQPVVSAGSNIRGRYPVHAHRVGVGIDPNPGVVSGCYVSGTPGWAITHHDSFMHINDNVVYDAWGAGIVSEIANEHGKWNGNCIIGMASNRREIIKSGEATNDLFKTGIGMAFSSRNISVVGNVIAGFQTHAFGFMNRGNFLVETPTSTMQTPELGRYDTSLTVDRVHVLRFAKNRAMCGGRTIEVVKADPFQSHNVRSNFTSVLAWEVDEGAVVQYTAHYSFIKNQYWGIRNWPQRATRAFESNESLDQVIVSCGFNHFRYGIHHELRSLGSDSTSATHQSSIVAWERAGSAAYRSNCHGFMIIDTDVTSLLISTSILQSKSAPYDARPQTYIGAKSSLTNTGPLSVAIASATKVGNVWKMNYVISCPSPAAYGSGSWGMRVTGSITDSLGHQPYPHIIPRESEFRMWNSTNGGSGSHPGTLQTVRNIVKNFGIFRVSSDNYLAFREHYQDRYTGSIQYETIAFRFGASVNNFNGMTGVSINILDTVTTVGAISVPAHDGRAVNFE
jgi:hypothetical protein